MKTPAVLTLHWWNDTTTPRWRLAIGGLLAAVLVSFGTIYATNSSNDHKRTIDARTEQIRQLVDATVQLQVNVSAFTTEFFSDGKISTQTRVNLNKNINDQFARLRSIETLLSASDKKVADDYLNSLAMLVKAAGEVGNGPSDRRFEDMKPFWSALSKVTVNRNQLDAKLQHAI